MNMARTPPLVLNPVHAVSPVNTVQLLQKNAASPK
jgi:hypothetical protein